MSDCIFCEIVKKAAPASIVYEDDTVLAFLDIFPIIKGHTLVIPKKHFDSLEDCDEDVAKHLMAVIKKLNLAVKKSTKADGILNEVMNGEAAGQEVFHLHYHIVPRFYNDGFGWFYPKGYRDKEEERSSLDDVATSIREEIQ